MRPPLLSTFLALVLFSSSLAAAQVPFSKYTDSDWPNGVDLDEATGVSFGDYDADGWPDIFTFSNGWLWRNLEGAGWVFVADISTQLPFASGRYGSTFGDYNLDGLPDIATEPRKYGFDDCLHLLRNLGGGFFLDIAPDPNLVDVQPCGASSETLTWADLDGDGDLDLFLPIYPPDAGSTGNRFLHNLGPTGPAGAYRFSEQVMNAGLYNPAGSARPEGVQIVDIDGDGDLELYSNGHLYRNMSSYDAPLFEAMASKASGIKKRGIVDEGTIFMDFDLDGDLDLLMSYTAGRGNRIWENLGDGTFAEASTDVIEDYMSGAGYGISSADWDNDGDLDFTANDVFRRNMMMETGVPGFTLLSSPNVPQVGAPAWADWDLDGDMDLATADGPGDSWLYQNDTYGPGVPLSERRHVRIRVANDASWLDRGLETEYGARVELTLHNAAPGLRFTNFVSSSAGYINQNEYGLNFALPPDPEPTDPAADVRFSVSVNFPSLPDQGYCVVGPRVNPVLANLDLALLEDREIIVFRSGKVVLGGSVYQPLHPVPTHLITSGGGLIQAPGQAVMPDLEPAPGPDHFVGIELDTIGATVPVRLEELILDGELGAAGWCGNFFGNVALWDVTVAGQPELVAATEAQLPANNRRGHYPVDMVLPPGRMFRLVAHVNSYRETPLGAPVDYGIYSLNGGLRFDDVDPCSGSGVELANVDSAVVYMAVRVRPDGAGRWFDLGHAQDFGGIASPMLTGSGPAIAAGPLEISVSGAPPQTRVHLVVGSRLMAQEQKGVLLQPDPAYHLHGITDAQGDLVFHETWPAHLRPGYPVFFQAVIGNPNQASGVATSSLLAILGEAKP
jgi:VCBS repeat protein